MTWDFSCLATDTDYEIYEGIQPDFSSHAPRFCSTGGATMKTFAPRPESAYYLVVPRNDTYEGSYGSTSDGFGRPRAAATCLPQAVGCGGVPPNVAPLGVSDSAITPTDQTVVIDVLINDSDPDGGPQPLFVVSVTQPQDGAASVLPGQGISYTPNSRFSGDDSLEYTLSDGLDQTSVPVNITVGPSPPDPTCTMSANPDTIPQGGSSVLTWSSTGGVSATLEDGRVATTGTLVVSPITTATYTLTVYGQPGTLPATCQEMIAPPPLGCLADEACPVQCGNGLINNLLSGELLVVQPEDMVHVLILADGYTNVDIAQFHLDVDEWMDEWLALDVYDAFEQAFCIWKMPALSNENTVPGGGVEDTAFRIYVNENESVDLLNPEIQSGVAQRIWAAIEALPNQPTSFYPDGGRTDRLAKNVVIVAMIYRTSIGASGYSGKAYNLENPDDPSERVATAMAHTRPHEFTHAFTRLWDEYIDFSTNPANCQQNDQAFDSPRLSNVVCDPQCALIPWRHLILGGEINPGQDNLVGSFGHPDEGYHPELICLMNGTRDDNATVFGGDTSLRDSDRMCNYCREVTAFRLFERIHVLDDSFTSYPIWEAKCRLPFFNQYGFKVPADVPQESAPGVPVFHPCVVE
jgi:hypothetical protein